MRTYMYTKQHTVYCVVGLKNSNKNGLFLCGNALGGNEINFFYDAEVPRKIRGMSYIHFF